MTTTNETSTEIGREQLERALELLLGESDPAYSIFRLQNVIDAYYRFWDGSEPIGASSEFRQGLQHVIGRHKDAEITTLTDALTGLRAEIERLWNHIEFCETCGECRDRPQSILKGKAGRRPNDD